MPTDPGPAISAGSISPAMPRIFRNGRIVADEFAFIADDVPLPDGPVIVTLKRFLAEKDHLLSRAAPLGVRLAGAESPELLGPDLPKLKLVELHVGYFKDGRATEPVTAPTTLGFPNLRRSMTIQVRVAADAERWVASIVMPASAPDFIALPALKPNQPTHRKHPPTMTIHGACGGRTSRGNPSRGPIMAAMTRADIPAVTCTTIPPAKSMTP